MFQHSAEIKSECLVHDRNIAYGEGAVTTKEPQQKVREWDVGPFQLLSTACKFVCSVISVQIHGSEDGKEVALHMTMPTL